MYKLVILIEPQTDIQAFEQVWPKFLKRAEKMPGLIRESTSHIDRLLHGKYHVLMMHELYFESLEAATEAMASPEGRVAGELLQIITAGGVTLLFAEHKEDELKNIMQYQQQESGKGQDVDDET